MVGNNSNRTTVIGPSWTKLWSVPYPLPLCVCILLYFFGHFRSDISERIISLKYMNKKKKQYPLSVKELAYLSYLFLQKSLDNDDSGN